MPCPQYGRTMLVYRCLAALDSRPMPILLINSQKPSISHAKGSDELGVHRRQRYVSLFRAHQLTACRLCTVRIRSLNFISFVGRKIAPLIAPSRGTWLRSDAGSVSTFKLAVHFKYRAILFASFQSCKCGECVIYSHASLKLWIVEIARVFDAQAALSRLGSRRSCLPNRRVCRVGFRESTSVKKVTNRLILVERILSFAVKLHPYPDTLADEAKRFNRP
ncbi:unnamed protein product [Peronospora belbahrii]|uniref:Uncharacterized protein n=1 Tax=Peronospora belbahrii TaxID=622444 RepID=A0AAU9L0A6_9STRA|nr:unnamed protein product [Peronospora belbahrii]